MKNYYYRFLFVCFIFNLFSFSCFAQPSKVKTVILVDPVGHPNPDVLRINCNQVDFAVYIANLELLTNETVGENLFPLPNDVPNLYVELQVRAEEESENIYYSNTEFNLFEFSHIQNNVNIYEAVVSTGMSYGNYIWTVRLLKITEEGDVIDPDLPEGFSYYPMREYRSPGSLFPCGVSTDQGELYWSECMTECSEGFSGCTSIGFYQGMIYCDNSIVIGPGLSGSTNTKIANKYLESTEGFVKPIFSPNPFFSNITCVLTTTDSENIEIELYNINEQLIQSWERETMKGKNEFNLLVDDIPAGIYFIKYSHEKHSSTTKLVRY